MRAWMSHSGNVPAADVSDEAGSGVFHLEPAGQFSQHGQHLARIAFGKDPRVRGGDLAEVHPAGGGVGGAGHDGVGLGDRLFGAHDACSGAGRR